MLLQPMRGEVPARKGLHLFRLHGQVQADLIWSSKQMALSVVKYPHYEPLG